MTDVRIVIASVLKPLYEPRMYEKIGISLSEVPNTNVHVIGYGSEIQNYNLNITAHGLGYFSRLSFTRLFSPWKVLLLVFRLKPQILIACTHELLLPFVVYKIFSPKTKLVYDLQENYYLNILYTSAFPLLLRLPIALFVRLKERLLLPFYSLVLSAEKCYMQEMPFIQAKAVCIENKVILDKNIVCSKSNSKIVLLYTGTISKEYGIYEVLAFAEKLQVLDPQVTLKIRGYCAHTKEAQALQSYFQTKKFIDANDISKPISHKAIIEAIQTSNWGLISYQANKATQHRIPTKLYEYMAYQLPIICTSNRVWADIVNTHHAGFSINFHNTEWSALLENLKSPFSYTSEYGNDHFLWKKEELKLKTVVISILLK